MRLRTPDRVRVMQDPGRERASREDAHRRGRGEARRGRTRLTKMRTTGDQERREDAETTAWEGRRGGSSARRRRAPRLPWKAVDRAGRGSAPRLVVSGGADLPVFQPAGRYACVAAGRVRTGTVITGDGIAASDAGEGRSGKVFRNH